MYQNWSIQICIVSGGQGKRQWLREGRHWSRNKQQHSPSKLLRTETIFYSGLAMQVLKMKVNHDILCVLYSIRFSCMVVCCCSVSLCCTTLSWLCTSTSKETKTLSGKIACLTHLIIPMFPSLFVEACCAFQVLVILFLYLKALGGFVFGLHRDFPQVNDNPCSKQGECLFLWLLFKYHKCVTL